MARPFSPIVQRIRSCFILVQVVLRITWIVLQRSCCETEDSAPNAQTNPAHVEIEEQNDRR